ncbi:hypothetical protein B0I37DRAFT_383258 [Chaetomium sp. MPI-CAGE-AT-0009]|nr:hypothetical protein B0I37DRAFT_383258 [Chaetomium sp. MPI-CAGE-AT-0009]
MVSSLVDGDSEGAASVVSSRRASSARYSHSERATSSWMPGTRIRRRQAREPSSRGRQPRPYRDGSVSWQLTFMLWAWSCQCLSTNARRTPSASQTEARVASLASQIEVSSEGVVSGFFLVEHDVVVVLVSNEACES